MKRKSLSLLVALQIAMVAPLAHADILFKAADPDVCSKLPGNWSGSGTVKALGGMVNCNYSGSGQVTSGTDSHNFNLNITLTRQSGVLCPTPPAMTLQGTCNNGAIALKTTEADLKGTVDSTGSHITDVAGTITFALPLHGKVVATVSNLNLNKS